MLSNVFERDGWYYFQYPGGDCNIGPYRSKKECEQDCISIYTTGMLYGEEKYEEPTGTVKCVECEDVTSLISKKVKEKYGKKT